LTIVNRVDGSRLLTITGSGLVSSARWNLVAPSGAVSPLAPAAVNDLATGALNRIWTSPDGRSASALVGAVDPVLREPGTYALSYAPVSGSPQLVWPSGGVPFSAPSVSSVLPSRLTALAGGDLTVSGDGFGPFLGSGPSSVQLVAEQSGVSVAMTIKAKTSRSLTVSIPRGTAAGTYHLVVSTPLGTATTLPGSLTVT
jgi:hypothetical protein